MPACASVELVIVMDDCWEGLYVDGELFVEDDMLDVGFVLAALKRALDKIQGMATFTYTYRHVDYLRPGGRFPKLLADVPQGVA